ncbi:RNA polymerase-binding protein DksA [Limnohabitans radicicola]|uniref:RNA polymerase-binding protein DksA n=1 Tax=Limnohabitans radicicola TaxID=2771427 RepID=UPI002FD22DAE
MKTPAKKAAKAAAPKAKAKVVASPKKPAAKAPVKPVAKAKVAAKAVPAKKPASKVTPVKKAVAPQGVAAKTAPAKKAVPAKPVKAVKPAAKAAPAKKATQPVATPKAAAKPVAKAKPAAKAVAPAAPVKAAAVPKKPSPVKAQAVASAKKESVKKVEPAKTPVSKAPVPAAAPVASDQPVRSTRPSARLAQITVPSLPPAVASTAAKASYLPSMSTSVVSAPVFPVKKDAKLANNWKTKTVDQLSDAEILAMPDSEYMNDLQMAYFRRKLVGLKQDILANAGETTEHLREDTVVVPDPADRATIEEEHALELRTRDRERKLLKKIEQSIIRIDAGDYGYCDETGEPIGVGRLLARPTATLSLEAQQRRELKQKMFGD